MKFDHKEFPERQNFVSSILLINAFGCSFLSHMRALCQATNCSMATAAKCGMSCWVQEE